MSFQRLLSLAYARSCVKASLSLLFKSSLVVAMLLSCLPSAAHAGNITAQVALSDDETAALRSSGIAFHKNHQVRAVDITLPVGKETAKFRIEPIRENARPNFIVFKSTNDGNNLLVLTVAGVNSKAKKLRIRGLLDYRGSSYELTSNGLKKSGPDSPSDELLYRSLSSGAGSGIQCDMHADTVSESSTPRAMAALIDSTPRPPVTVKVAIELDAGASKHARKNKYTPEEFATLLFEKANTKFSAINVTLALSYIRAWENEAADPFDPPVPWDHTVDTFFKTVPAKWEAVRPASAFPGDPGIVVVISSEIFSGGLEGGRAGIGVLCNPGFAVITTNSYASTLTQQATAMTHELGHVFGMEHTGSGIMVAVNPPFSNFDTKSRDKANAYLQDLWSNHNGGHYCLVPLGEHPTNLTIGGTIRLNSSYDSAPPVAGVVVDGGPLGTAVTDANGYYEFTMRALTRFTFVPQAPKNGDTFYPTSWTDNATSDNDGYFFTLKRTTGGGGGGGGGTGTKYQLSGSVNFKGTSIRVKNITVFATDQAGKVQQATTDAKGAYSFSLLAGTYDLRAEGPTGYSVSRPKSGSVRITSKNVTTDRFSVTCVSGYKLDRKAKACVQ